MAGEDFTAVTLEEAIESSMPLETLQPPARTRDAVSPPPQSIPDDGCRLYVFERRLRYRFGPEILDKIWPISLRAKQLDEDELDEQLAKGKETTSTGDWANTSCSTT